MFGNRAPVRTGVRVQLGDGYISPSESVSWKPTDVRIGLARQDDGELICVTEGSLNWERLTGDERIALGYLLSKALGHPNLTAGVA